MEQQEFLKHCRYYKGEQDNPYNRDEDYNRFLFWAEEKDCYDSIGLDGDFLTCYIEQAKSLERENKKIFEQSRSKNLSATTKGIILYIEYMATKWNPYIDCSFIFEY